MLQRIQTVFLFLAIVCLGLFLWMPLIRLEARNFTDDIQGYNILHFYNGWLYFVNAILVGTAILLSLINIFMYKRRSLQMVLCWFAIVFIAAAEGFVYYKYNTRIFFGDVILRKWNLLSLAAVIFELLAIYYIRKDEELVKSMDRLR